VIDAANYTKQGQYSNTPLFELELRRVVTAATDVPEGLVDASAEMTPNRTYFVRDGRPLYNTLVKMWAAADGDKDDFVSAVLSKYKNSGFRGRVERLTGVTYTKKSRAGDVIQRSRMEAWYPEDMDSPRIMEDFIYLCNTGVYTPVEEDSDEDPTKILAGVDTAKLKAFLATLKK
jgi:hypothetical protein